MGSKSVVISAPVTATASVAASVFVKQDGSGGVVANDAAATAIGFTTSSADNTATPDYLHQAEDVGVVKQGLIRVPATVAAAYEFGDAVELQADGQTVVAGATNQIGTAAETKTTTSGDPELLVYVNFA